MNPFTDEAKYIDMPTESPWIPIVASLLLLALLGTAVFWGIWPDTPPDMSINAR